MPTTIKKIESIKLNGSNKYAGGYIYSVSFQPSFAENPSQVRVNIINEKGSYTPPKLNLSSPVDIQIGDLKLGNFFVYKSARHHSSQGTILELFFCDPTFVLDKFWVGLIGKHGWSNSYLKSIEKDLKFYQAGKGYTDMLNETIKNMGGKGEKGDIFAQKDNLILMGRLFHPCDANKDNVVDFKEDGGNIDYCDPCPHCSPEKMESKCLELGQTRIFQVGYSFKDFIENWKKINFSNGVKIEIEEPNLQNISKEVYEKFYAEHTGSLRDVLTTWCAEFGLSWYYDFVNKIIKFIDLSSKEIEVREDNILAEYKDEQLISYDLEETIENTEQRGVISWYEREGEKKPYDCTKAEPVTLAPVFAADYFGNRERSMDTATGVVTLNSNDDAVSSILHAYYPALRDAFWFKSVYNIAGPDKAMKMITTLEASKPKKRKKSGGGGLGEDEEVVVSAPYTMPELGNMKILAVVSDRLKDGDKNKTPFQKKANGYYESFFNQLNTAEQKLFVDNSGFFLVSYYDEDYHDQRMEVEQEAFDFMGRYFMREHLTRLCGITGNQEFVKNNTQVESADGSAEIYAKNEVVGSHPLTKYKYYASGCLGCILGSGVSTEAPKSAKYTPGGSVNSQGFNFTSGPNGLYLTNSPASYKKEDGPTFSKNVGNQVGLRLSQTAIILEREPQWVPTPDEFELWVDPLSETKLQFLLPKKLGPDGFGSDSKAILEDLGQTVSGVETKIKVFVAYNSDFEAKVTHNEKHPKDQTVYDKSKNDQISRRIGGKFGYETKLGLIDNTCSKIELTFWDKTDKKVTNIVPNIYTPPHCMRDPQGKEIVKNKFTPSNSQPCDACLSQEKRPPGYKVFVTQSFTQSVVIPKLQTGVASGLKAPEDVMNFDINYNTITNDDLEAYTGYNGYGCIPNLKYLENINNNYASATFQNKEADKSLSMDIKGLPKLSDISSEMEKGLAEINITINDQGISSNLLYSTKTIKAISPEIIKRKNETKSLKVPRGV